MIGPELPVMIVSRDTAVQEGTGRIARAFVIGTPRSGPRSMGTGHGIMPGG